MDQWLVGLSACLALSGGGCDCDGEEECELK